MKYTINAMGQLIYYMTQLKLSQDWKLDTKYIRGEMITRLINSDKFFDSNIS